MPFHRILILSLLALATACHGSTATPSASTTAAATPPAAELPEAQVLAALEGREWNVDSPRVRDLGPGAASALLRIADDDRPERVAYQRVRALLALRHQKTPTVETFLLEFVRDDHDAPRLRAAIDSLAVGFGATDRDRVVAACQALASHPDGTVAEAARRAELQARVNRALTADTPTP